MTKLVVDGVEIDVDPSLTLLEAVEQARQEVPRFCYHPRLSVAGNCRMCLVDVVGEPKLVASCSRSVRDIRPGPDGAPAIIETQSEKVTKARASVMEFLLINHPLDCPICDQGGECDLQDQAMLYGLDTNRYSENKRAVEDKALGPLIKTTMTRCIHCTRCVRFMTEVAGVEELGATGRGETMEIMSYLERGLSSEMQGNIADLCPVGALTHKPSALSARAWEYDSVDTVDAMDGLGSHIRLDSRGERVLRILPRTFEAVNAEWLSDKSRYCVDGLASQRLDQPYVRRNGRLEPVSWQAALSLCAEKIKGADSSRMAALAGDLVGVEEGYALKSLLSRLGAVHMDGRAAEARGLSRATGRATYLFNSRLAAIDTADALLLIGCNPRQEATVFNARIRQRWLNSNLQVGLVGTLPEQGLNYDFKWLGSGTATLQALASGDHSFIEVLKAAKKPLVVVGEGALFAAPLAAKIAKLCGAVSDDWLGYNVLHSAAARVGNLEIDLTPGAGGHDRQAILEAAGTGGLDVLYLMGFDDVPADMPEKPFVIYQGSHGDRGAHLADVVLPGAAYSEKSVTYVNTEGRVQLSERAVFPPGEARDDWSIIRALSGVLGLDLPFNSLEQLRQALYADYPDLAALDSCLEGDAASVEALAERDVHFDESIPLDSSTPNLYQSNVIARASRVLAEADRFRSSVAHQEAISHG